VNGWVDRDKGREQTVKLGGGCMTIMERMALRLEGPTFSLHTSRGTSTACAICTHTHTYAFEMACEHAHYELSFACGSACCLLAAGLHSHNKGCLHLS